MGTLEFGLFDGFSETELLDSPPADVYDGHIRRATDAERLRYGYYFFIEHQNAPAGYITAPNVYLAALARETSTLRFGPMVYQLPMHHPIRLAQDAAMVDQLSRGRLEFGIGYGIHEHEFLRWGLPFHERREMGVEAMEIVLQAWTQESVTYDGEYWSFDEALPKPRPFQQPHPPIWVGAHSATSLEYAARHNYHVAQNLDTDAVIAEKFDLYRQAWQAAGHPGPMPHIMVARNVHVAPTDAQARVEAEPCMLRGRFAGNRAAEIIAKTRVGWGSDPTRGTGGERTADIVERGRVFQERAKSYDFWIDNGLALVGSPDTVIRQLRAQQERIGYDVFCASHQIGDMPPDQVARSIQLFAEEVIPAFR